MIRLSVNGSKVNFNLTEYEMISCDFIYKAAKSKYAKSGDERCLRITGNITAIAHNNPAALSALREWGRAGVGDEGYYNAIKVTHFYREEEVRVITFSSAFIKSFSEKIDPFTGNGQISLLLMQKPDKRTDIIIEPFNQVYYRTDHGEVSSSPVSFRSDEDNEPQLATMPHDEPLPVKTGSSSRVLFRSDSSD